VRYFFRKPSVRTAACATLGRASQRIAPLMAAESRLETQARMAANVLVFGLRPLRRIWSPDVTISR